MKIMRSSRKSLRPAERVYTIVSKAARLRRRPLHQTEKSRAEVWPLRSFAAGAFVRGGFGLGARARFAGAGGTDFVGGFVAGAFKGAPHVPTGDGAVRAPTFAEGQKFLGLGHVFFAVSDGPAFFHAEVVDGKNVGAAEAEDQKHFDGPCADAADGDETLDEFFVRNFLGLFEGGDDAVDGSLCKVFHSQDFCAGETGLAKDGLAELEHFLRSGGAAGGAEGLDAAVNGGGGFARDGLVGDGFKESFVGRLQRILVHLERECFCDQTLQALIVFGEVFGGCGKVEGEGGGCHGGG